MSKPKYLQIAEVLQQHIESGKLGAGAVLPREQDLQREFAVSRVTIRKALAQLVEQDLLYRVQGSGTYVKSRKARHNALRLSGFLEEVSAQGKVPTNRVLRFELIGADAQLAQRLNVDEDEQIYAISRLRLIDGEPEMLEQTWMPLSLFPDLSVDVMTHSKYHYIEQVKGMHIALSRQSVFPDVADESLAELLKIPVGQPILRVLSTGEFDSGAVFEYTVNYYRVNQYSFDFVAYRAREG